MAKSTPRKRSVKKKPAAPKPLRIAIVGKAPSSRALVPILDDDLEIWTLSNLVAAGEIERYDRHFEIHKLDRIIAKGAKGDAYWPWMQQADKPIYLRELHPDIPSGVLFPKDAIVAKYGTYFTNTVSWMIALAIEQNPVEISVYGVDMAQDSEYSHQRPSCEYFLGIAVGRGIKVHIPEQADMLKCHTLYGFDTNGAPMREKFRVRTQELSQRIGHHDKESQRNHEQAIFLSGARDNMKWCAQALEN